MNKAESVLDHAEVVLNVASYGFALECSKAGSECRLSQMETSMSPKMRPLRADRVWCLLGAILILCCTNKVHLTISGPAELSDASIFLDGVLVGEFPHPESEGKSTEAGVVKFLRIPRGQHKLEIRSPRFPPIAKRLDYGESVYEDYILITLPEREGGPTR